MRTMAMWIGAVLMVGGLWSASVISLGLAEEPAAPSSSSQTTGGAAGEKPSGSKAVPPVVEGQTALPTEAVQVRERTVSLTQAVHFTDATGQDVVVAPGSYRAEAEGTNRIRLFPARRAEAVVLDAVSFTHQETVERPVPVTIPDPEQPDVLHLALVSPGGMGLEAIGTYSGVKSRAVTDLTISSRATIMAPTLTQVTATAVAAPSTSFVAPAGQYAAPTPSLTAIANAFELRLKSLTTLVILPSNLPVTHPVEVSIGFYSPAKTGRISQSYVAGTGNRFLYLDAEGDGKPRGMRIDVSLTEQNPGGQPFTFAYSWNINLDPLYDVTISPLNFYLRSACDILSRSEIRFEWIAPDAPLDGTGVRKYSFNPPSGGFPYPFTQITKFAWARQEVSVQNKFHEPVAWFWEYDPGLKFKPNVDLSTVKPLLPNTTHPVHQIQQELGGQCSAAFDYSITYTLRSYPYL